MISIERLPSLTLTLNRSGRERFLAAISSVCMSLEIGELYLDSHSVLFRFPNHRSLPRQPSDFSQVSGGWGHNQKRSEVHLTHARPTWSTIA